MTPTAYAESEADSEEQAVLDIKAVFDDPNPRPVHVSPPLPGSFGELAEPHLLALQQSYNAFPRESEDEAAIRKAVFAGERPFSDLPPRWFSALEANRAHVTGLLQATHASVGRLPWALTFFAMFSKGVAPYSSIPAQFAVKLASVDLLQVIQSRSPGATAICLDQLAVARDLSRGSLVGQMVAASVINIAAPSCALALRAANAEERKGFRRSLEAIQAGWTPMSTTLRQEIAFFDLMCFDQLSASTQKEIPEGARLYFSKQEEKTWTQTLRVGLFGRWARRSQVRKLHDIEAATALPPKEGDATIQLVSKDKPVAMSLAYGDESSSDWVGFFRRARSAQARLVILDTTAAVLDARDRLGHWPASWSEVGVQAPLDPRTALPLRLIPGANGVRIQPELDGERTVEDLGISVR